MLERLPAYAPEMNPVEGIWGYLSITPCPATVSAISVTLPVVPAAACAPCNVVRTLCRHSGSKLIFSEHVTHLRKT